MNSHLSTSRKPLILFVWAVLAAVVLLQIHISGAMEFWSSLFYVTVIVSGHVICAHTLADLVLPYFIRTKRMFHFALVLVLVCIALAVGLAQVDLWLEQLLNFQVQVTNSGQPMPFLSRASGLFIGLVLSSGAICGIRFYAEHNEMEKKHQQLRAEHLEAELKLLRDQINPHFMFNVLNSIHVLMHKDTAKASEVLFQFSDMLRYQLYDCSQASIPLEQEVAYLQNFVQVEKVRWGSDLRLNCEWPTQTHGHSIAPFILAPFVENAFKHMSRTADGSSFIIIRLTLEQETLHLEVKNSCHAAPDLKANKKIGGIGLENVQKRLELLYENQHELQLLPMDGVYYASLKLNLGTVQGVPQIKNKLEPNFAER